MAIYFLRRFVYLLVVLVIVSIATFVIIQLPPGDYLTTYVARLSMESDRQLSEEVVANLRQQYGLDQSIFHRYLKWAWNMLHGNFGVSFEFNQPVIRLIGERMTLTIIVALLTMTFTYAVAIPIGIYSAIHQYSPQDYLFTGIGFIGLATPNFLLALVLMFLFYKFLGINVGGLFSLEYVVAPWSLGKFMDLLAHLPIPIIVIGTAGTAKVVRMMRASLLDELRKQYVITARAKGVPERALIIKYPVRMALNPIISSVAWLFPQVISGTAIVAIVLNLPTTGPLLFRALLAQDMFLAGGIIMIVTVLTVVGTFVSDILLMISDPRVRF